MKRGPGLLATSAQLFICTNDGTRTLAPDPGTSTTSDFMVRGELPAMLTAVILAGLSDRGGGVPGRTVLSAPPLFAVRGRRELLLLMLLLAGVGPHSLCSGAGLPCSGVAVVSTLC